jgi:hypothetical protein
MVGGQNGGTLIGGPNTVCNIQRVGAVGGKNGETVGGQNGGI